MSYCVKNNESYLHIFQIKNLIFCYECILTEHQTSVVFDDRDKLIDHVLSHALKDHKIPKGLHSTILEEINQVGQAITGKEEWINERSR
jgi:hypothetical protein